jgi:hypothetical protein
MSFDSLYDRWYSANIGRPLYAQFPEQLSVDSFRSTLSAVAEMYYDECIDITALTADDADVLGGIFTADELMYLLAC